MRLGVKIALSFVIVSLIVIFITGYVFFIYASNSMEERIKAQLDSVIILKKNQINMFTEHYMEELEFIAEDASLVISTPNQTSEKIDSELRGLIFEELKKGGEFSIFTFFLLTAE